MKAKIAAFGRAVWIGMWIIGLSAAALAVAWSVASGTGSTPTPSTVVSECVGKTGDLAACSDYHG